MRKNIWAIVVIGIFLIIILFIGFDIYGVYKETPCSLGGSLGWYWMPPGWKLCACDYMKYEGDGKFGCIMGCETFLTPLKCVKGYIQNQNNLIKAMLKDLIK